MSNVMPDGADEDLNRLIESLTMGEQVMLTTHTGIQIDRIDEADPTTMLRGLAVIAAQRIAVDGAPVFTPDVVDALTADQVIDLVRAGGRAGPRHPQALAPLIARINSVLGVNDAGEYARPFRAPHGGDDRGRTARHAQPVLDHHVDGGNSAAESVAESQHPMTAG